MPRSPRDQRALHRPQAAPRLPRRWLLALAALLLAAGSLAGASPAQAKLIYGLQLGATSAAADDGKRWQKFGVEFAGRGGWELPIPFFDAELELLAGMSHFGGDPDDTPMVWNARVGMRGGVNWALYPQGFFHVGYGRGFGYRFGAPKGVVVDVGVALDLTAIPYLRLGIYGAYNHMVFADAVKVSGGDRDLQWFSFGITGNLVED